MIEKPLRFDEAINFLTKKKGKPNGWSAADWQNEKPAVRQRAFFTSRVENARFIARAQELLGAYMEREIEPVIGPDGIARPALKTGSRDQFVKLMRDFMIQEGMARKSEFKSVNQKDIRDIRSVSRLKLIFDTNTRQAFGYGQWKQGMKPAALRAFPAARLIRDRGVREPRIRHQVNLGEVLLKTDPRWAEFHNDPAIGGFGVPWGPFGYNSGCTQEDVSRAEAKALGLNVNSIRPPRLSMNEGMRASIRGMDDRTKRKLLAELRKGPGPVSPKDAAKAQAQIARREMLNRGLKSAIENGQEKRANQYRKAMRELEGESVELDAEIVDDRIRVVLPRASDTNLAGDSISPKVTVAPGTRSEYQETLERSMRAIDSVHGDGPLPPITFYKRPDIGRERAYYSPYGKTELALRESPQPEISIMHETAHWMDHRAFGVSEAARAPMIEARSHDELFRRISKGWGSYGDEFKGFREAVKATKGVKAIEADYSIRAEFKRYLLTDHELFARAYAQWIAQKSGEPVLKAQIDRMIAEHRSAGITTTQWDWSDFDLVSGSLDTIFEKRGWLRK